MGLTRPRAYQIFDIDYKQAVRVVQTSNITLAGGAPAIVDGVSLSVNDRVLVTGQSTASQNGLYYVTTLGTGSNGTWSRSVDGNETGEIQAGLIVMVTQGNSYADTQWKLTTDDPITVGVTALVFVLNVGSVVGGLTTQVQFNDGGVMGGTAGFTFDKTTNAVATTGTVTATGNITGGNISISGVTVVNTGNSTIAIQNGGGNGVGNIGAVGSYFNTVFAKATSAQYADLAEMYVADANYAPGTVVEFGGAYEITQTTTACSTAVAGIISTNPSYLMNSCQAGEFVIPVALTGRVPCCVQGPVRKGDVLVSSNTPGVAQRIGANWQPGCTVGKAMEDIGDNSIKIIEVAVGRL